MAVESSTFETITPSRFTTFTFPNPSNSNTSSLLRFAVLDSPLQLTTSDSPRVAAMLIPKHRHSDWIFSTESGHLQLLLSLTSLAISRLILIGPSSPNDPSYDEQLGVSLKPLLLALSPKSCFNHGIPDIPILSYEDDVVSSVVLEKCVGGLVGEMVVEDVELACGDFRRRLRFKRMPNLVQTQVRIVPDVGSNFVQPGEVGFRVDDSVFVHPYLVPMVASLSLVGSHIDGRIQSGLRPKALCLGVGGGALLSFLRAQLGFHVVGVEADEEVLRVSRQYFGLEDVDHMKIYVGDAVNVIERLARQGNGRHISGLSGSHEVEDGCDVSNGDDFDMKFDVIMVDLDSSDARDGLIAPPMEFVRKHVLLYARSVLCDGGILAMNVIPSSRSFYETLIHVFRDVFHELYEIDVGNGENFILIALASPLVPSSDCNNCFLNKLGKAISGAYLNSIHKI